MCRTLNCFMQMSGHGVESVSDLLAMLAQIHGQSDEKLSYEEELKQAIARQTMNVRINEAMLEILQAEPPEEGAKLAQLNGYKAAEPEKHGFATLATYELESGSYLVVAKDHLTQDIVSHTTLNVHGLRGLQESVLQELAKKSIAAAEAKETMQKAKEPDASEEVTRGSSQGE